VLSSSGVVRGLLSVMFVMMDSNSLSAEGCQRVAFVTTGGDVWVGTERVSVGKSRVVLVCSSGGKRPDETLPRQLPSGQGH
jgi:hypothetical protein